MKYEFNQVVDGLVKYINKYILPGMNQIQDFGARVMMGRFLNNSENIRMMLINNGFVRTFGIIDADGVEIEELLTDIKKEIARQGKISFDVPLFGKMTFEPGDVDVLYQIITEKEIKQNEDNQEVC
jgi:hypothetical protein